jgi:AcrR family transcriptional regulator
MRAKSDSLAAERRSTRLARASGPQAGPPSRRRTKPSRTGPVRRLKLPERRAQILAKAVDFFADYGLTAQTRALAEACGVSQRLLYRVFPNKAALVAAVYEREIVGPFKAVWYAQLSDRSTPVEARLGAFYRDYFESVLTRRWLRLFLYASLAEIDMAPAYIAAIVTRLLETIVEEAAAEQGLALPEDRALVHEIGWALHGAVSHLAIRRRVYGSRSSVTPLRAVELQVRSFLAGLPAVLENQPGNRRRARPAQQVVS